MPYYRQVFFAELLLRFYILPRKSCISRSLGWYLVEYEAIFLNKMKADYVFLGGIEVGTVIYERLLAIFLCLVAIMNTRVNVPDGGAFALDEIDICSVELSGGEVENGIIEVALSLECEDGFCGVLAEIEYCREDFLLLFCGMDGEEMKCSFYDGDGCVRILLDGAENYAKETVRLYFERRDGFWGEGVFEAVKVEVYRFDPVGEICSPDVDFIFPSIEIEKVGGEDAPATVSVIEVMLYRGESGETDLMLKGSASDSFFATGFRIFAIELDGAESESLEVVGITHGGQFEKRVRLTLRGSVSVVVTPLAYNRLGAIEGDKRVFVFEE